MEIRSPANGFGGIIPSLDPIRLPPGCAQQAHNVDLSGGTLKPWMATNEFGCLHDSNGDMVAGFPSTDIAKITQASQITKEKSIFMANPWWKTVGSVVYGWMLIKSYMFYEYLDPDTEEYVTDEESDWLYPYSIDNTPTGFIMHWKYASSCTYTYQPNVRYKVYGPIFQFQFSAAPLRLYLGAPDDDYTYPIDPSSGDGQIPSMEIPLIYPSSMDGYIDGDPEDDEGFWTPTLGTESTYQYGTLKCTDYGGPQKTGTYELPDSATADLTKTDIPEGTSCQFSFSCGFGYAGRGKSQKSYYVQQMIDSSGRDGPKSDVSDEIVVEPGTIVKLSTPLADGYTANRIYRSSNAGDGFMKLDDVNETYFWDDFRQSLTDELPPNGNVPHDTVAEAVKGAIKHPAGYFLYYYGSDLRPSSEWIDLERPWACPEEYAYSFDSTIQCIALLDATVLVFTENGVFRVLGQHPARLSVYQISDKPILDKLSLWRTNDMVGWVTEEGMVAFSGGVPQLMTGEHYRADEWQKLLPTGFSAFTNDKTVCLFQVGSESVNNLRFDLRGPRQASLSTFTNFKGTAKWKWKGEMHQFPRPVAWYALRVVADDYPIVARLYGDGLQRAEVSVLTESMMLLPRMVACKRWEVYFEGRTELRSYVVSTSTQGG